MNNITIIDEAVKSYWNCVDMHERHFMLRDFHKKFGKEVFEKRMQKYIRTLTIKSKKTNHKAIRANLINAKTQNRNKLFFQ